MTVWLALAFMIFIGDPHFVILHEWRQLPYRRTTAEILLVDVVGVDDSRMISTRDGPRRSYSNIHISPPFVAIIQLNTGQD